MISYDLNGVTLFYVDSMGSRVSAGPMDTSRYMTLLNTHQMQVQAESDNTASVADYNAKLLNFQASIDAGRIPADQLPPKPHMKVVHDDGTVAWADFIPALGDVRYPAEPPTPSGIKAVTGVPPDRLDVVIQLLTSLHTKVDKLGVH